MYVLHVDPESDPLNTAMQAIMIFSNFAVGHELYDHENIKIHPKEYALAHPFPRFSVMGSGEVLPVTSDEQVNRSGLVVRPYTPGQPAGYRLAYTGSDSVSDYLGLRELIISSLPSLHGDFGYELDGEPIYYETTNHVVRNPPREIRVIIEHKHNSQRYMFTLSNDISIIRANETTPGVVIDYLRVFRPGLHVNIGRGSFVPRVLSQIRHDIPTPGLGGHDPMIFELSPFWSQKYSMLLGVGLSGVATTFENSLADMEFVMKSQQTPPTKCRRCDQDLWGTTAVVKNKWAGLVSPPDAYDYQCMVCAHDYTFSGGKKIISYCRAAKSRLERLHECGHTDAKSAEYKYVPTVSGGYEIMYYPGLVGHTILSAFDVLVREKKEGAVCTAVMVAKSL